MYSKTFQTRNSRQNSTPDDLTQPVYIKCHVCCDEFVTFDLAFSRAFHQPHTGSVSGSSLELLPTHRLHELTFSTIKKGYVLTNKSSNIEKTTTTNQYRRVPDLWRPGSDGIKRYYTKNGGLISTAKLMHQSIPTVPIPPPPEQPRGICSRCQSRGWGIRNFTAAPGAGH